MTFWRNRFNSNDLSAATNQLLTTAFGATCILCYRTPCHRMRMLFQKGSDRFLLQLFPAIDTFGVFVSLHAHFSRLIYDPIAFFVG